MLFILSPTMDPGIITIKDIFLYNHGMLPKVTRYVRDLI